MDKTEERITKHIGNVQYKLKILADDLIKRGRKHDASKLKEPELSLWKKMDEEPMYMYGTPAYFDKLQRNKAVFDLHYANKDNRHHPEHFPNGYLDMNLVDLLEMLCDWISYRDEISISEALETVERQAKRFGFSEDLEAVLKNTLLTYFSKAGVDRPDKPPAWDIYFNIN